LRNTFISHQSSVISYQCKSYQLIVNLLTHDLKSETKLLEHQKNQSPLPITDLRRLRRLTQILICEILLNP
jgi:hypothetical protein